MSEEEEAHPPRQSFPHSTTEEDAPWAVLFHGENQTFYSTSNPKHQIHRCNIPQLLDSHIIGHSNYGWLILRREIEDDDEDTSTAFSLLNPVTLETIQLPLLSDSTGGSFYRGELTLPPSDPNCRVVIVDSENPQLAYCKPGGRADEDGDDDNWTMHTFSQDFGSFMCLAADGKGSLYAVTGQAQLVNIRMDNTNNIPLAELLAEAGPPTLPYIIGMQYWNLVESAGELLWIILCYRKSNAEELELALVYKLDRSSMSWVEAQTLNGRAIFISGNRSYSFSCSCSSNGTKPNCVYFFLGNDYRRLHVFDVERGQSLCFMLASSDDYDDDDDDDDDDGDGNDEDEDEDEDDDDDEDEEPVQCPVFLNYATHRRPTPDQCSLVDEETSETYIEEAQVKVRNETKRVVKKEEEEEEKPLILKLPSEILTYIAKKLDDYRGFRNCCKTLKSTILLRPPPYPWFFYFKHYKGNLNFQDVVHGHTHEKQVVESLSGVEIVFSTECWLVMGDIKRMSNPDLDPRMPVRLHITFYNPFTKEVRTIPEMIPFPPPSIIGISAPPTSPDCCIIEVCIGFEKGVIFNFMRLDDQQQHLYLEAEEQDFELSYQNTPIFLDDKFYYLDKERRLGVFSFGRDDEGEFEWTWDVHDWKLLGKADDEPIEDPYEGHRLELGYLVECGGEILAVLVVDEFGKLQVQVYRFNQEHKGWLEVEDLGTCMLFVSRTSCFSTVEKIAGMGNKIYFARVSAESQSMMFYSLDTRECHTFNETEDVDFESSWDVHLCGWIKPT